MMDDGIQGSNSLPRSEASKTRAGRVRVLDDDKEKEINATRRCC